MSVAAVNDKSENAYLYVSTDLGITFKDRTANVGSADFYTLALNDTNLYVGTGDLLVSHDAGLTFTNLTAPSMDHSVYGMAVSENKLYVTTINGLFVGDLGNHFKTN